MAALDDAAGLGRGVAAIHRFAPAGAAPTDRSRGIAPPGRRPDRGRARRRKRPARKERQRARPPAPAPLAHRACGSRRAGQLAGWLLGTGFFALVIGLISTSISSASIPTALQRQLQKLGAISITNPSGSLGFDFLFFVLAVSLFACSQIAAARREEADERLETLFALPVDRCRWLAGRLLLATAGASVLALGAGVLAWVGAATQSVDVSLATCWKQAPTAFPPALLFFGLGALAFALLPAPAPASPTASSPPPSSGSSSAVCLAPPPWLLDLSPFQHVGLVPAQPFRSTAAAVMLALAVLVALAALWAFRRRDLAGV